MSRAAEPAETREQRMKLVRDDIKAATVIVPASGRGLLVKRIAAGNCVDHAIFLLSELEAATRQRDALLAACKAVEHACPSFDVSDIDFSKMTTAFPMVSAAIALCPPPQAGRGGTDGGDEDQERFDGMS